MDPDSFLNLLSPELNEFDEWCQSPDSPPLDLNPPCLDLESQLDHLMTKHKNSSSSYSSVIKLSDIASALHGFSKISTSSTVCRSPDPPIAHFSPESIVIKRPHGHAVMRCVKPDLESDEMEDEEKPFDPPFHKRHCPPEHEYSAAKRLKLLSPASPDSQTRSVTHELQQKSFSKEGLSQREIHIRSERQRRRSMRDSFTTLQALVPKLKLKHTDRITVLTEVITYIQSLQGTLEELERKKSDIMALLGLPEEYPSKSYLKKNMSSLDLLKANDGIATVEVTVRLSGNDLFVTLNAPKKRGVWSGVLMLLQRYNVEVVNATLATSGESNFHCIHGKVAKVSKIQNIDLQDKLEELIVKELTKRPRW